MEKGGDKFVTMSLPDCRHAQASSVLTCGGKNTEKGRGGVKERQNKEETTTTKKRNKRLFNGQTKTSNPFLFLGPRAIVPSVVRLFLLVLADSTSSPSPLKDGGGRVSFSAAADASTLPASPAVVESGEGGRVLEDTLDYLTLLLSSLGEKEIRGEASPSVANGGGQGRLFSPTDLGGENGRVSLGGGRRSEKRRRKKKLCLCPFSPDSGDKAKEKFDHQLLLRNQEREEKIT